MFYFFHSRKFTKTHETFWSYLAERIGQHSTNIFIITDCEEAISHSKTFNNLQYMCCEMLASSFEGTKFNKWLHKCNAPLVRLETNGMLKCFKGKQLCDDDHVKFSESEAR